MTFWNGEKLIEQLPQLISPFRKESVDCAAYTLMIGPEVYVSPSEQTANPAEQKIVQLGERESFVIPPGQVAFLLTEETVTMPKNAIGFISMKAVIKFRGLINVSGFHVDPGYTGRLVFAVFNAGPVPILLRRGDPCFLIWYADLNGDSKMVKNSAPVTALSAAHINGIAGELHSIESLAKKIKDVEKAHEEKINELRRDGAYYKVAASILLTIALSYLIKDCSSKHDNGVHSAPSTPSTISPNIPAPMTASSPLSQPAASTKGP